jgi:hypothetical protein
MPTSQDGPSSDGFSHALARLGTLPMAATIVVAINALYIALVAFGGWKPLARWERGLPAARHDDLAALGLVSRSIQRRTAAGTVVHETVLARGSGPLALYAEAFDDTSLRIDAAQGRLEGWLLGFPSCCVAAYVEHGYLANALAPAEQAELFHWACPGCTITPRLLPHLRDVTRRLRVCLAAGDDGAPVSCIAPCSRTCST